MAKFEWRSIFELGVPEIDSDHRELLSLAERIGPAVSDPDCKGCPNLVDDFLALVTAHFKREEEILQRLGYPGLAAHTKYHTNLMDGAHNMKAACQSLQSKNDVEKCYKTMTMFLVDDFVRGDLPFKSFLQTKGYGV